MRGVGRSRPVAGPPISFLPVSKQGRASPRPLPWAGQQQPGLGSPRASPGGTQICTPDEPQYLRH